MNNLKTLDIFSNTVVPVYNQKRMVQYGIWPNCPNSCDFCLLQDKVFQTPEKQIFWINAIIENIKTIDWTNFPFGISLLGGELYYIKDENVKAAFLSLIDTIIEYVLRDDLKQARYSTVTNGLYEPSFLFQVLDRIIEKRSISRLDINFSYDLKYRYKNENARKLVLENIQKVRQRYNYRVGVQMILTQHVINLWKENKFDINELLAQDLPGCQFAFLYPHKVRTGKVLPDFFFNRKDFLNFLQYLKNANSEVYINFTRSVKNSAIFKYTGLLNRNSKKLNIQEQPILADDKSVFAKCGHSILYRCYADSDKCILCDLENLDNEL